MVNIFKNNSGLPWITIIIATLFLFGVAYFATTQRLIKNKKTAI
jgi:hypothetical protein